MTNTSRNNQIATLDKKPPLPTQLPDLSNAIEKVEKIPQAFSTNFQQMVEVLSVVRPMVNQLQEDKKLSEQIATKSVTLLSQTNKTFAEQNKLSKELNESVGLLLADTKKLLENNKQLKKDNKELSDNLDRHKKIVKYLKIAFTVIVLGIIGTEAYQHYLISNKLTSVEKKIGNVQSQTKANSTEIEKVLANQDAIINSNLANAKKKK